MEMEVVERVKESMSLDMLLLLDQIKKMRTEKHAQVMMMYLADYKVVEICKFFKISRFKANRYIKIGLRIMRRLVGSENALREF